MPGGTLTREQLEHLVSAGEVDTVSVVFSDLYGRLMGKRFDARFFLDSVAAQGTHGCDYLLTVDMEMEPVAGYDFANWDKGYGDVHLQPDDNTLRQASWLDRTAIVISDVTDEKTHQPVPVAPRSLLGIQLQQASEQGFAAMAASELEYYLFENTYRDAADYNYQGLEPAGWYLEDYHVLQATRQEDFHGTLRRQLAASGIPVESTKGEWGLGQHEINIQYCEVLEMADRHVLLKQMAKEIAQQQDLSVTFMAKYDEQQAGSSCHVHLSLWKDGSNAFAGSEAIGEIECSDVFRWFLGGWIAHAAEFMPFYAPNVNSYKRYQSGSWAPTTLAWSRDNRTAGFRVVGNGDSLRIECRMPGADCNPYLAYTAALASGLDGIANQLDPPSMFEGDAYHAENAATAPADLGEAIELFSESSFVGQALGEEIQQHYSHFFETERAAYQAAVTDWERRRYFERI
ncbi:MAG: glutamine synthetase family protein [Planctomycetota bacterium]|nr:glutamine synthetase family protein [Planctomycetota bacterium]